MEKLDKVFERFHASYFAFLGIVVFLIGIVPAMVAHSDFSLTTTYISDLAVPGWNDVAIFFSVCWFITGLCMLLFIFGFTKYLQEKDTGSALNRGIGIACILGIVSAIGILLLALFNTRDAGVMHDIGQYVFFFPGILYLLGYAVLEKTLTDFPLWQVIVNIVVAFFFIVYLILFIINRVDPTLLLEAKAVAEWLFLFANLFWFVENGIFILKF